MIFTRRFCVAVTLACALPGLLLAADPGVKISELAGKLRVEIGGELFTEYNYQDVPRPFLYPVIGPTGTGVTRNWPMKEVEGEERDHVHHRGVWYGHQLANGHSFWGEGASAGKIVHDKFLKVESGPQMGVIQARNKWVATSGSVICTDVRTLRIFNRKDDRILDFDITIEASNGDLVLGDDKDAGMSIRVAESMRLKKYENKKRVPGDGHIVTSEGVRDGDTWGQRAAWCDYYGPVDGKIVGVAIFDHPQNPRHPTWWHVRDYGLFTANPFGIRHFEKLADKNAGNMTIPAGESVTFRYRFYWHQGDEKEGKVAERYQEYVAESAKSSK